MVTDRNAELKRLKQRKYELSMEARRIAELHGLNATIIICGTSEELRKHLIDVLGADVVDSEDPSCVS